MNTKDLPLPEVTIDSQAFWTGGEHGYLLINKCNSCDYWIHPPVPACRQCGGGDVNPTATQGTGAVLSYTINRQQWTPNMTVPYVIAIVELDEQPGLRLTTRIVDCAPEDVSIGLRVQVRFERNSDIWLPVFYPTEEV